MLIGDLYARLQDNVVKILEILHRMNSPKLVIGLLEKYKYAKRIDPAYSQEADKKISQYTEQAPDKTSTFQVIGLDQETYKIECWYLEIVNNPHYSN